MGIGVKEPEGHIHSFDLIHMILTLENPGQQCFSFEMCKKRLFGVLFVQLKWKNKVGAQQSLHPFLDHYRIVAERTGGGAGGAVNQNLSAAGRTDIDIHPRLFLFLPFTSLRPLPVQFVLSFGLQLIVQFFQGLHFKFGVAIGTLHLLKVAGKFQCPSATGTFILDHFCHFLHFSFRPVEFSVY